MKIRYTFEKEFTLKQLHNLFLSVKWLSANYPDRLYTAMQNAGTVITAWDGDQLVGLISAIDDGTLTAYIPYLLINPDYQKDGIGKKLLEAMKEKYKDYLYLLLVSEDAKLIPFYNKLGFEAPPNTFAMAITNK